MVVEDLHDMHVPAWLLRILISYLTERTMTLSYNGITSTVRYLPGSTPQCAFLGVFLFIVKYNGAALRPIVPRITLPCRSMLSKCKLTTCQTNPKESHAIYVDDHSEAINLQEQLTKDPIQRQYPLNFHERTQHVLSPESSLLQKKLLKDEEFSVENLLKINKSKSKIIIFNSSKKYAFPPEYSFSNGEILEVVDSTCLLDVTISANLRWEANTKNIQKKAMAKMWLMRKSIES